MDRVRYGRKNPWRTYDASILETNLLTSEKLVYIVIASHATAENQTAFPSYNTIARKASISRRKAIQAVNRLIECGYLYRVRRKDDTNKQKNKSNLYVLFPASQPFNPDVEWVDDEGQVHEYPPEVQKLMKKLNRNPD